MVRQTAEVTPDESMPSTSSDVTLCEFLDEFPTVDDLRTQLEHEVFHPWTVETTADNEDMKFQLHDDVHSIAKYTVLIKRGMEFTVYVFNWPIPDNHVIYNDRKRRIRRLEDCKELLHLIENSNICDGLPQDEITQSVVIDPTSDLDLSDFPGSTVVRHSVPKSISPSHFQSSVTYRSPSCEVVQISNSTTATESCDPCAKTLSVLGKKTKEENIYCSSQK